MLEFHIFSIFTICRLRALNQYNLIWITDPQSTEPQYLNDTNNARYKHSIKTLDCEIGRFHWSNLNNQMLRHKCTLRVGNPYIIYHLLIIYIFYVKSFKNYPNDHLLIWFCKMLLKVADWSI
jgi:hypothetical protein